MPNELLVRPGDLITADLWNKLLSALDALDARIDANEARVVPDVVGDLLATARDEIARARLEVANVLDAAGTRVDAADAAMADRIVLAQMPSPDDLVRIGRKVTLLITPPKVKTENAPDITAVNVVGGGSAQVGRGLEIIGTAFTGRINVTIRNTPLEAGQFTVDNATKITIPKVPAFDGAPSPGTTKPIPITVANEVGSDSFTVNFTEPQIVVAAPVITNVRFLSPTRISILGAALNPPIQDVRVTMLNDDVRFRPISDGEIHAETNEKVRRMFANVDSETLEMLLEIDRRDLFLVDIPVGDIFIDPGTRPSGPRFDPRGPIAGRAGRGIDVTRGIDFTRSTGNDRRVAFPIDRTGPQFRFLTRNRTVKLFLLLAPSLARAVASVRDVKVTPAADHVAVVAGRVNFRVDLARLAEVEVEVRAADKQDTFTLLMGEVG